MQMMPHLAARRLSPPELCQTQRLQSVLKSILQQFWRTAVTTAGWRQTIEYLKEVLLFAVDVQEVILFEEPSLQLVRPSATLLFHVLQMLFKPAHLGFTLADAFSGTFFHPMEFSLHELALTYQRRPLFWRDVTL